MPAEKDKKINDKYEAPQGYPRPDPGPFQDLVHRVREAMTSKVSEWLRPSAGDGKPYDSRRAI